MPGMEVIMNEHYLDNASTTRPCQAAVDAIMSGLKDEWGNPSSLHHKGQAAEKLLEKARRQLADILLCDTESIFFTSCATESINTAILGACERLKRRGKHILTTKGEHAAVFEVLKDLSLKGYEVEEIENDGSGRILLEDLKKKLRPDTILVSLIHVNNEIGTIQPVMEAAAIVHQLQPDCLVHVDATQSFCKLPLFPSKWGIDLLSASAHKINGPKGIGLLYVRRHLTIKGLLLGGGQEHKLRSGTENVPYIAGFGCAAEEMWRDHAVYLKQWAALKERLLTGLADIPDVMINGPKENEGVPYITNLRVAGIRSEVLLHALEDDGVYISSGSACSSNKPGEKSRPLHSLGLGVKEIDESIRVSFGRYTTEEDIDAFLVSMHKTVPVLRRFIRK